MAGKTTFIIQIQVEAAKMPIVLSLKYPIKNKDTDPLIPISASAMLGMKDKNKYVSDIVIYASWIVRFTLKKNNINRN